jgi:glycosyltransferase involved in cell wall biosynthesis
VNTYKAEIHVVNWDKKKIKPYIPPEVRGVTYYKRSEYSKKELLILTKKIGPDIVYISGWMDRGYLYVTKQLKRNGIPVVTAFDDMWVRSFRQVIGSFIFPFYFKKFFTHAWVAGAYQYEFARRLGFNNNEIIFDMLSADTKVFNSKNRQLDYLNNTPKAFLYVGNFRKVKGFDILIKAFNIYKKKYSGCWKLICVGNGELLEIAKNQEQVEVFPFSKSEKLIEISKLASVFILPSRHDQWGVVVHEFASLGMPLILSEHVGSRSTFFIDNFNGLMFYKNSPEELAKKMFDFTKIHSDKLQEMSDNSILLSKRITIESSSANFISILKNKDT